MEEKEREKEGESRGRVAEKSQLFLRGSYKIKGNFPTRNTRFRVSVARGNAIGAKEIAPRSPTFAA